MGKLKKYIKDIFISLLPDFIILELDNRFYLKHRNSFSYSQEGEDVILERIFEEKQVGFFIDIGAHHPTKFSNTYKFYLKGWRGVNIDATPGSMEPFKMLRPEDVNIELGVTDKEGELIYYIFDEPALNTFSKERVDFLLKNTRFKLNKTVLVHTKSLKQIMEQCVPLNKQIDFLTIDVEGLDYDILLTNDWSMYRPYILLIETLDGSIENMHDSKLHKFLHPLGYELISKTHNTAFFRDSFKSKS